MPCRRPLLLLAALALAPLAGCAGNPAPSATAAAPAAPDGASADGAAASRRDTPPRMLRSGRLAIRRTTRTVVGAPSMPASPGRADVALSVEIGADGRPDMGSLVISGSDAPDNREDLRAWIAGATFAPATRAGVPVPGTFRWRS